MILRDNLIGVKQSISDEFLLLKAYQTPLLNLLGFGRDVGNTKHEWLEDKLPSTSDTVTGGSTIGATATALPVVDASKFAVDNVISAGDSDELMLVTAVNTSTNVLTITRHYTQAAGVAAVIPNATAVNILYNDSAEGKDARAARYNARTNPYNYLQIFDASIEISGTAEAVDSIGINTMYEYEKQKKILALALEFERALINGNRYAAGTNRKMGGIRQFIATNVTTASSVISEAILNEAVAQVERAGGLKSGGRHIFMVPPSQVRRLSALYASDVIISHDSKVRGRTVDVIRTDYGEYDLVINPNLRNSEIIFTDTHRLELRALKGRQWFHQYLGKKGDYTKGQIIGEYTVEVQQEEAHSIIKALTV